MNNIKPLYIYGFTIFFNAAISFGVFSILTHYLTEVDYGIINLYTSFSLLLTPFIALGIPFVIGVDYFKLNLSSYKELFKNALIIPVLSCLILTVAAFFFHAEIIKFTKVNYFFAVSLPFLCLMIVLNETILTLIRNKENYLLYSGFSIFKNLLETGFTIILVVGLSYNWVGRIGSNFIALILGTLAVIFIIYKWSLYSGNFNKKIIAGILISGLPFVPERLAIFVLSYSDRFFIDYFNGTAEVGYYGVGAQLSLIVTLAIITLNNTFYPPLFKALNEQNINYKQVKKVILKFLGVSLLVTFLVLISIPVFFKYFIGPAFQPAKQYAIYLIISMFFWSIYNVFVVFLLSFKHNKLIMNISILGMILSLVLNYINVRFFGAIGAVYTSIIVYSFMAAVTIYSVHRRHHLKKIFA